MRAATYAVLLLALSGCVANQPQTTTQSALNKLPVITKFNPDNAPEYVILELPDELKQYGYMRICRAVDNVACSIKLEAEGHAGEKFIFDSGRETKKLILGSEAFPIITESGERLYVMKEGEIKTPLPQSYMLYSDYEKIKATPNESLLPGSGIAINYSDSDSGSIPDSVKLTNGEFVNKEKIPMIRDIAKKYKKSSEVVDILADVGVKYDKIENTYTIKDYGYRIGNDTRVEAVIVLKGNKPNLYMTVLYKGSDGLFVNKLIVIADDFRFKTPPLEFYRDNSASSVWEWVSVKASGEYLKALEKISSANDATIRFVGDQFYDDFDVTQAQKDGIARLLKLYRLMQ